VSAFHGLAFFRGGIAAAAPRSAMAPWHLRVSQAPSAVTLPTCLTERHLVRQVERHRCVANVVTGDPDGPNFQCLHVNPDVVLASDAAPRTAVLARSAGKTIRK